jgi:hypothetical protein
MVSKKPIEKTENVKNESTTELLKLVYQSGERLARAERACQTASTSKDQSVVTNPTSAIFINA